MKNNNQLIICDIDGTLIDLDNHFLQGFNNKLKEIGLANYQLSLEEYIDCVITGSGFKDIGNLLLFKKGLLWKKPFQLQKIKAALMDFYPKLVEEVLKNNAPQLITSTVQLLKNEQTKGVKIAYVTNNTAHLLQNILEHYEDIPKPDGVISQRDENGKKVNLPKPHPAMFLKAMALCDASPKNTFVLGNVPNQDGLAALRAGIPLENILLQESDFLKSCPTALRNEIAQKLGNTPTLTLQPTFPTALADHSKHIILDYPTYRVEIEPMKSMFERDKERVLAIVNRSKDIHRKIKKNKDKNRTIKVYDEQIIQEKLIDQKNCLLATFTRKDMPNKTSFVIYARAKDHLNTGKILTADWSGILAGLKKDEKNPIKIIQGLRTIRRLSHEMLYATGLQKVYVEGEQVQKEIIFFSKFGMGFQQVHFYEEIKSVLHSFFDKPIISQYQLKNGAYQRAMNSNPTVKMNKMLFRIDLSKERTFIEDLKLHLFHFFKVKYQIWTMKSNEYLLHQRLTKSF